MAESAKQRHDKRLRQLKNDRSSWIGHWHELSNNFMPRRGRWMNETSNEANRGEKRNHQIVDTEPRKAARTLQAGMMSGLTSPARPWFKLTTSDPELAQYGPVKDWLFEVEKRMRQTLEKSNLYNVLPNIYGEMGVFGQGPAAILSDPQRIVRFYPMTVGSYFLGQSDRLEVDTIYRELNMTVRQIVQRFGLNNASKRVQGHYSRGEYEQWIKVVHAVEPRTDRDTGKLDDKNMPYKSVWYEQGSDEKDGLLYVSGFHEFPAVAPRWETTAEDVYGSACPGMDALGAAKALQFQQRRHAQVQDKIVNPPMGAPASLRNQKTSLLPGSVTYFDAHQGQQGFTPLYQVDSRALQEFRQDHQENQRQISEMFYADLFLMIANSQDHDKTATEVAELKHEKLLMLGPVLERLNDELLDPIIERTFSIMNRAGVLPPPPQEINEVDLHVEYISVLAQAQQMVGLDAVDRVVSFAGNLAGVKPEAMDKIDVDKAVDQYSDMLGVPPTIIRSDDAVQQIRQQRAQQEQEKEQAANMAQMADTAEKLSKTDTGRNSALDQLLGTNA